MEELQSILHKYKLELKKLTKIDLVVFRDEKMNYVGIFEKLCKNIVIYKFIHDNMTYIEDLVILDGFEYIDQHRYKKDNKEINIYPSRITIRDNTIKKELCDPDTLFEELREFLNINPIYKPVRSTFA